MRRAEKESEKAVLNFNIQKNEDHGIWSITLWHINGGKVEIVADFIFLGSKITVDSNCSYKIKRHLLFGRKAMTNLTMYQKAKTTLMTKLHIVKAIVFPVVMSG